MHHHLSLRAKIIIMISVMASMFVVALDQTIIATSLTKIVEEFNAFDSLSWIVTAYLLTTTITVPIAGKMSDLFGRRLLLLLGVAVFGVGSLMSGAAGSVTELILWRAFQGIGGGLITANAFTIIGDLFAARERGRWQGLIGAVFGLSSLVGPLLGGWLTDPHNIIGLTTNWRWTFWINVPIAIAAFIIIAIFCPPLKHSKKPVVDYAGAALLTIVLGTFVLAIDNTATIFKDLMDSTGLTLLWLRVIMYTIVVVGTAVFIAVERRAKQPILPLHLFSNKNFVLIIGTVTLFGAAFLAAILYLTQFNQLVFGASPTESGLMLLPMVFGMMTSSISIGQLITRTGKYKIFMQFGIITATVMLGLLTTLGPDSSYAHEAIMMGLLGLGLGAIFPVTTLAIQNEFELDELGVATSSNQLFRSLGSTIGIAVLGAVLTSSLNAGLSGIDKNPYIVDIKQSAVASKIGDLSDSNTLLNINMPDVKDKINEGFEANIKDAQIPDTAKQQARSDFKAKQDSYNSAVNDAFSDSLRNIFIVSTGLMALAVVMVFMLKERTLKSAKPDETPGEI